MNEIWNEEEPMENLLDPKEAKDLKVRPIRFIPMLITFLIFLLMTITVTIGFYNLNQIKEEKEPIFLWKESTQKEEGKDDRIYHFGLYKIRKEEGPEKIIYTLRPFFMK